MAPITAGSSHSASGRGTGKSSGLSADNSRYSRSTACADGRSDPNGFRRSTYSPDAPLILYVGFDWPDGNLVSENGPLKPSTFASSHAPSAASSIACSLTGTSYTPAGRWRGGGLRPGRRPGA